MGKRRERGKAKGSGPRWLATGEPVDAPEPPQPQDMDAAVTDGLVIARFSVVMALKNRLIVSALRDGRPFDRENAMAEARDALETIAREQDQNAVHADESIADARRASGAARHEHDYKRRDLGLLSARRAVYTEVAQGIRSDAGDEAKLAELVEDARARAWDEISREVANRLDDVRGSAEIVVDDDYRRHRDERMRRLREFDLWELADRSYARTAKRKRSR
ncbi:hypothetical protein VD659_04860 [Herbiconiux sp. 11R-BC]|uniref:hypothetical protein n=1 Tax=Herbiconiux sp. 11R-BC TaxID=3111637 RepID=UPI003BFAA57C